jgi:hypothetical protein
MLPNVAGRAYTDTGFIQQESRPGTVIFRLGPLITWDRDLPGAQTCVGANSFHCPDMETGSVFEMSMYLSHLSWLWFWEHFIEFCHHRIFKMSVIYPFMTGLFWEEVFLRSWYFHSWARHSLPSMELKVYHILTRRSEPDRSGSHFYICELDTPSQQDHCSRRILK